MTGKRTQIQNLRDRIQVGEEISDEDAELLLRFSDEMDLLKSKYTDHRHIKLLRHATRIAENVGGLADVLKDREASKDIVRWINREYQNEYTNHDYRTALRVFAKRVTDEEGIPASVEWVPSGTSNSHDPVPNPADMLEWEADVKSMIDAARNPRDKALIAVAFDSGARNGELQKLTVGDVNDHEYGLQILVDGKGAALGHAHSLRPVSEPLALRPSGSRRPRRPSLVEALEARRNFVPDVQQRFQERGQASGRHEARHPDELPEKQRDLAGPAGDAAGFHRGPSGTGSRE
jgi:integrase